MVCEAASARPAAGAATHLIPPRLWRRTIAGAGSGVHRADQCVLLLRRACQTTGWRPETRRTTDRCARNALHHLHIQRSPPLPAQIVAGQKELKGRIDSVKNTQKITDAMKLVAAAKVRRAQDAVVNGRPFAENLVKVLALPCRAGAYRAVAVWHPYVTPGSDCGSRSPDRPATVQMHTTPIQE